MGGKRSVVVIEDDPDLRFGLENFLGKIGYDVITAKTAEEGLSLCLQEHPRVVLCDIMLPGGGNGYEVCAKLKGDPTTGYTTQIILLSARPEHELQMEGSMSCADFYIPKPADPNDIGADLYYMFEKDFRMEPEDISRLRVTRRVPSHSEFSRVGYTSQRGTTPRLNPPKVELSLKGQPKQGQPRKQEVNAEYRAPEVEHPVSTTEVSSSREKLHDVHSLLSALKQSIEDTNHRVDAVLQYIEIIN